MSYSVWIPSFHRYQNARRRDGLKKTWKNRSIRRNWKYEYGFYSRVFAILRTLRLNPRGTVFSQDALLGFCRTYLDLRGWWRDDNHFSTRFNTVQSSLRTRLYSGISCTVEEERGEKLNKGRFQFCHDAPPLLSQSPTASGIVHST